MAMKGKTVAKKVATFNPSMANPYLAQQDQMQPVEQPVMLPPPFGHQRVVYDGKRMRKPITRRVVDFYSDSVNHVTTRAYAKHYNEYEALQPHEYFVIEVCAFVLVPFTVVASSVLKWVSSEFFGTP
jgi:hypothetical protein